MSALITHLETNAKDENGARLFNRVDAGNTLPLREIQPEDCNAILIYRDEWQQDHPATTFFGGTNTFDLTLQVFWYLASEGNENEIDVDAQIAGLRHKLLYWLEVPNDGSTDGLSWYSESNEVKAGLMGPQTVTWFQTDTYRMNGEERKCGANIYSAKLTVRAWVHNQ